MPRTLQVGSCAVVIDDEGRSLTTTFPDGSVLPACGNADPESVARAHELGYAGDTWAMSRDHEIAHSFLAAKAGLPCSATLRRAALGGKADTPSASEREREECAVLVFQRFARTGEGRWDVVFWLGSLNVDFDDLAAEFRALVDGGAGT